MIIIGFVGSAKKGCGAATGTGGDLLTSLGLCDRLFGVGALAGACDEDALGL